MQIIWTGKMPKGRVPVLREIKPSVQENINPDKLSGFFIFVL